jgi:hypothetical protein
MSEPPEAERGLGGASWLRRKELPLVNGLSITYLVSEDQSVVFRKTRKSPEDEKDKPADRGEEFEVRFQKNCR